jgi:hypothetical protein
VIGGAGVISPCRHLPDTDHFLRITKEKDNEGIEEVKRQWCCYKRLIVMIEAKIPCVCVCVCVCVVFPFAILMIPWVCMVHT